MLHIITPLYRYENLPKIYNSIFKSDEITWHISKTSRRQDPDYNFIKNDKMIKLYNVDCDDSDTTAKRNCVLEKIKNGYFCFIDDDTILHENMFIKYLECKEENFVGMIVGEQIDNDNVLRLIASPPRFEKIDTGNVISHHKCLEVCRWPSYFQPGINQKDFLFWESVYNYFSDKCGIWNQPISYYNKLT